MGAEQPGAQKVPTIQELLGDKLEEKIEEASSHLTTVAESRANLLTNITFFGARPGKLELTKETLLFLPDDRQTSHIVLVSSIKSVNASPSTVYIWTDKKYGFKLRHTDGTANLTSERLVILLKQLNPNIVTSNSSGVQTIFKWVIIAICFVVLMYFSYLATQM